MPLRRLVLSVLATTLAALAFTATPALAAAPTIESESTSAVQPSEANPNPRPAVEVRLEGVVNPNNDLTECHFQYSALLLPVEENTVSCEPELLKGSGGQGVGANVGGLSSGTTYHYRIVVKNGKGEEKTGTEEEFTTATEPETPEGLEAKPIGTTMATLKGVLNPNKAGEAGTYEFAYRQSEAECQRTNPENGQPENEKATPSTGSSEETPQAVSAPVTELQPGAQYTFCLIAHNSQGETAISSPVTFTTQIAPPKIASESVSVVEAMSATLEAQINPNGAETTYHFEYDTAPYETSAPHGTDTPDVTIPVGTSVVSEKARLKEVLTPSTTYHYRVVAENKVGGKTETEDGKDKTFTTPAAPVTPTENCPNAKLRGEQPYGTTLRDWRAYEMVSPTNTGGQDATYEELAGRSRAALAGEAVTYESTGAFSNPAGAVLRNRYLSRREPGGWSTQDITPLQEPTGPTVLSSTEAAVFTPELTAGIAASKAVLAGTEAEPPLQLSYDLYLGDFSGATPSYRYVGRGGENPYPWGASTDLSHVVFGGFGGVSEWVDGSIVPVGVANDGERLPDPAIGGPSVSSDGPSEAEKDAWHAVSGDGSRVYFTSPGVEQAATNNEAPLRAGPLFVRVNAEEPQSPSSSPEANATGALTAGSTLITAVEPVFASLSNAIVVAGSREVTLEAGGQSTFPFAVGQPVSGAGIPVGDEIVAVSAETLTLSEPAETSGTGVSVTSTRADSFTVGEGISGYGLAPGTTVTKVESGALTVSAPSDVSASGVSLEAGGECVDPGDACTIDVSASQRSSSDTHGVQFARYWGASVDGSRVFFTSTAELTDTANTGPADEGANLYEYDLGSGKLTDLSLDTAEAAGAAVQGVVQISEDGSYVYFVANGVLTDAANARGEYAKPGNCEHVGEGVGCNLYVYHQGEPEPVKFIATLAAGDVSDWQAESAEHAPDGGPAIDTAAVGRSGASLAFVSERSLTGYDNKQAKPGDCERNGSSNVTFTETGACREVYLYDAETGVVCASCNPSGARPKGPASLGGGKASVLSKSYRPRNVTEAGALFFESADALVPGATGGNNNVYEYEGGAVRAISHAAGGGESFFLDASASGSDVFFATDEQLVSQDPGGNIVVYDARVEGGFPAAGAACTTAEACRNASPPTPAVFGPPPSATFSGPGNVPPPASATVTTKRKTAAELKAEKLAKALKGCRKDKKKSKRAKCENQARAKYGRTKARKKTKVKKSATNDRRAN